MRLTDLFEAMPRTASPIKGDVGPKRSKRIRDMILGYNDGDGVNTISLDAEVPDDVDHVSAMTNLRFRVYRMIEEMSKTPEGIEAMCKHWGVTPDQITAFYAMKGKRREFSLAKEARDLVTAGVVEPKAIMKQLKDIAFKHNREFNDNVLAKAATIARRNAGIAPLRAGAGGRRKKTLP